MSPSDLQSDAFDHSAIYMEKLVPQVGFEPTRPKALVSKTSAATYYATGAKHWSLRRGSNPHTRLERAVSLPLDDGDD